MKSLSATRIVLIALGLATLAAPAAAQENVSSPHREWAPPSSPSAFLTPRGEIVQFTYRVLVTPGKCVVLSGAQWLHPGGARLPMLLDAPTRVLTVSVKAIGKPVGLTLFANQLAVASDSDGLVAYPDGLLVGGDQLTVQVFNPSTAPQWAYVVVQVQKANGAAR